jgi:hypothetical protein
MTISISNGSVTADLTNCNTSVMKILNNPAFVISIPADPANPKENEIPINIGLLQNQYSLTFDLKDGIEAWSSSSTTIFGKLFYLSYLKTGDTNSTLTFTWGPITRTVIIVGLRCGTMPGKKDFLEGCSMTLQEAMVFTES